MTRAGAAPYAALHAAVASEPAGRCLRSFQALCGVSDAGVPTNAMLHSVFKVASALGDEVFYTVALPLYAWLVESDSRRLALFWASIYYVGQAVKDGLKLPRPGPPAVRLEAHYAAEYGLPSTHTMASLIPLFLARCHYKGALGLSALPPHVALTCWAWSAAISLSRLYMGVHSLADVAAGYLLAAGLLGFWGWAGDAVDAFLVGHPRAWQAVGAAALALVLAYPRPRRWTNSYGDTSLVVATAAGVVLGYCWRLHCDPGLQALLEGVRLLPRGGPRGAVAAVGGGGGGAGAWQGGLGHTPLGGLWGHAARCLLGFAVLLTVRWALRLGCHWVLVRVLPPSDDPPGRRHGVDIPSKLVTYGAMGFSAVCAVPWLWRELGLLSAA